MQTTNTKENFPDYKNRQENYNLLKQSEANRKITILWSAAAAGCEHLKMILHHRKTHRVAEIAKSL